MYSKRRFILITLIIFVIVGGVGYSFIKDQKEQMAKAEKITGVSIELVDGFDLGISSLQSFQFLDEVGGLSYVQPNQADKLITLIQEDEMFLKDAKEELIEERSRVYKQQFEVNKMKRDIGDVGLPHKAKIPFYEVIEEKDSIANLNEMFIEDDIQLVEALEYRLWELRSKLIFIY